MISTSFRNNDLETLSKKVLFERIKNAVVTCILVDNKIEFNVAQKATARVGADGVITVEG